MTKPRRHRSNLSWTTNIGGLPVWGIVACALLIVSIMGGALAYASLNTPADAYVRPAPSPTATVEEAPAVAVLGDSFVVGTGSTNNSNGWVPRADSLLAANVTGYGEIGTGFVNPGTGQPYGERITDVLATNPDYLVVQATLNDTGSPTADVVANAGSVFDTIAATSPDLPVALVGPIFLWTEDQPDILRLREGLAAFAAERGIAYIDPTGWITDETAPDLIGEDDIHPTDAGYQVIAERMNEAIRATFGIG